MGLQMFFMFVLNKYVFCLDIKNCVYLCGQIITFIT